MLTTIYIGNYITTNIYMNFQAFYKFKNKSVNLINSDFQMFYQLKKMINVIVRYNSNIYRLKGVIANRPGHFFAYCRRDSNKWELHDDLSEKMINVTQDPIITPTAAIFIIYNDKVEKITN